LRVVGILLLLVALGVGVFIAISLRSDEDPAPPVPTGSDPPPPPPPPPPDDGEKPPPPLPKFVEVAKESGLDFFHYDGRKGIATILETAPPGVGVCDVDQDGWLDIYVPNGCDLYGREDAPKARNYLFRNLGNWKFDDVTEAAGVALPIYSNGCVFGDYDNDGDPDLYVTNYGPNNLFRNKGDGTFEDVSLEAGVAEERWGLGCAFGDYDADGDLDLYVVNYVEFDIVKSRRECPVGIDPQGNKVISSCGPDMYPAQSDVLFRNNGDGTFTDVTKEVGVYQPGGKGLVVIFTDYDNDGDQDIFAGNDNVEDFLFQNQGDGTFRNEAFTTGVAMDHQLSAVASMGVDLADYDGDGELDMFLCNYQERANQLWRNEGNGFMENVTIISGVGPPSINSLCFGTSFFDYDNDGWVDIFTACGHVYPGIDQITEADVHYRQKNQLYRNMRDGHYQEILDAGPGLEVVGSSRGAGFGDIDNDGDVDIIVGQNDGDLLALRNDGGDALNFIFLQFVGVKNNRNGIGVRVDLTCQGHVQVRETRAGASFMSQSDFRLHFGIGEAGVVDKVEIRWPMGQTQTFENLSANSWYVITEGDDEPRLEKKY
jgi:hypothetical protein